jgi:hypothetical protein
MLELSGYSEIEALRDGHRVDIRAPRPEHRDDLLAAVGRIGTDSLYRRFFAIKSQFSEKETASFVNLNFVSRVTLIALVEEGGEPVIVADGREPDWPRATMSNRLYSAAVRTSEIARGA